MNELVTRLDEMVHSLDGNGTALFEQQSKVLSSALDDDDYRAAVRYSGGNDKEVVVTMESLTLLNFELRRYTSYCVERLASNPELQRTVCQDIATHFVEPIAIAAKSNAHVLKDASRRQ